MTISLLCDLRGVFYEREATKRRISFACPAWFFLLPVGILLKTNI